MLLALETATSRASLALLEGESLIAEREISPVDRHAAELLEVLDEVLRECSRGLEEVELIGLSVGPGSFTGLRIGLATALGLCFGTTRRIVPVPTLAALSLGAGEVARIVPLLDARRAQVYTGLYQAGGERLREDRVCDPGSWLEELRGEGDLWLTGPWARQHGELVRKVLGGSAHLVEAEQAGPSAFRVGELATRLAARGGGLEPREIRLRYLRRPDAQLAKPPSGGGHPTPKPII